MEVSLHLDRVTVTGGIHRHKTALEELETILKDSRWEQISDYEFALKRKNENGIFEQVAGLFDNPHQAGSWRLDTSNHLQNDELSQILIPISLMSDPHLTRIDIAFDIVNGTKPNMAHRIYRFGSSQRIYGSEISEYTGRARQIQTLYSGARKSNIQIRYYDKLAEQKSRRKELPEGVHQWERLEVQLRGRSTSDWKTSCRKMLSYFKMPEYEEIKSSQARAMLVALENHVVEWTELSSASRVRYRKLLKNDYGLNDDYSQMLLLYFDKHVDEVETEISGFLRKIDVNK